MRHNARQSDNNCGLVRVYIECKIYWKFIERLNEQSFTLVEATGIRNTSNEANLGVNSELNHVE